MIDAKRWPDVAMVPRARLRGILAKWIITRWSHKLAFRIAFPGEELHRADCIASSAEAEPLLILRRPESFYQRIGTRGLIGFGESYQAGDWDAPNLVGLLAIFAAGIEALVPIHLQWIRGHRAAPRHPRRDACTIQGARRNAGHHYDLPGALFASFLDETMTYSAALFCTDDAGQPVATADMLHEAQCRKIDRILDIVRVGEGTRLLEIGSGWGELAIRAGRRGAHVHAVSNSEKQVATARRRIQDAGLMSDVQVKLGDYRELPVDGRPYDAIASVEMIEAVGEDYLPLYFSTLDRLLTMDGTVGLQLIVMSHERMMKTRKGYSWIHKYIFPGGLIPSLAMIEESLAHSTTLRILDRKAFGLHYASTLRLWRERFIENWSAVESLGFDDTFKRTWEFYLAYCEAGFVCGYLDVYQLLLGRCN
jgi:cyclopropane-fatty-acyl-phospholipid synthase